MGAFVHNAGAWTPVKALYVHNAGAWATVKTGWVHSGGSWVKFYSSTPPLSASGPGTVSGSCHDPSFCTASASATVTPAGGSGSYTYTWSRVSGTAMTFTGQGTPTATFSFGDNTSGQTDTAVFQCVVSDGTNSVTVTVNVSLTFRPF